MTMLRTSFFLLLAGLVGASSAIGATLEVAIGNSGEIVSLESGVYQSLFPSGTEAPPEAEVLALEIDSQGESVRYLVPGTETPGAEEGASLYADPTTGVTYVLWSSRWNGVHPFVRLVPFDGEWGEILNIFGSVFAEKYDPHLSVLHDSLSESDASRVERVVLNVFWWEDSPAGSEEFMKTLVLENGVQTGLSGTVALADLLQKEPGFAQYGSATESRMKLVDRDRGFLTGFVDASQGSVRILRVEAVPLALSRIAAEVAEAASDWDPLSGTTLEQTIQEALEDAAADRFHSSVVQALTLDLLALVEDHAEETVSARVDPELLEKLRGHIVHIGARLKAGGLRGDVVEIIRVEPVDSAERVSHHLAVSEVASWPIPETGDHSQLFVSKRGTAALVAWDAEDAVVYRETLKDEWGPEQSIEITDKLDRESIYRILEERALER